MLSLPKARVLSLVEELRSRELPNNEKKEKKERKRYKKAIGDILPVE